MHKHTHTHTQGVLKITNRQLGRAEEEESPRRSLKSPPAPTLTIPPHPPKSKRGRRCSRLAHTHPAPGVLRVILDLRNRCFTNTDFLCDLKTVRVGRTVILCSKNMLKRDGSTSQRAKPTGTKRHKYILTKF